MIREEVGLKAVTQTFHYQTERERTDARRKAQITRRQRETAEEEKRRGTDLWASQSESLSVNSES